MSRVETPQQQKLSIKDTTINPLINAAIQSSPKLQSLLNNFNINSKNIEFKKFDFGKDWISDYELNNGKIYISVGVKAFDLPSVIEKAIKAKAKNNLESFSTNDLFKLAGKPVNEYDEGYLKITFNPMSDNYRIDGNIKDNPRIILNKDIKCISDLFERKSYEEKTLRQAYIEIITSKFGL